MCCRCREVCSAGATWNDELGGLNQDNSSFRSFAESLRIKRVAASSIEPWLGGVARGPEHPQTSE